jgi:hypothetical protein
MGGRIFPYVILPLLVAAASLISLVAFALDRLMAPYWPQATTIAWYAAFAIVIAGVVLAMRQMVAGRRSVLILALGLVLAAGFLPRVVDVFAVQQKLAEDQAQGADIEMEFQANLMDWRDAVATADETGTPWTGEEAMHFLEFAASSDLGWHSLPDHTPEAYALLDEALASKVLDPNALLKPAVADSAPVTLTLAWYDARIRPGSPNVIERRPWEVLQMLVAGGADLTADDAAPLRADLSKTVVPGEGRFIALTWDGDAAAADAAPPVPNAPAEQPLAP